MKSDYQKIQLVLDKLKEKYNFQGPLHFTEFSNLYSLFQSGYLFSRDHCENNNVSFNDAAEYSVIKKTRMDVRKSVRFYYKEKTPTLYRNEGIKGDGSSPHVPIPVYLLFQEELLYAKKVSYSDGNAGSIYTKIGYDSDFLNNMNWDTIFNREPILMDDGPEKREFIRERQAELLAAKPVTLKKVKSIIFRAPTDYKRAIFLYGQNPLYNVNKNMFNNLQNYVVDYQIKTEIIKGVRNIILTIELNNSYNLDGNHYLQLINSQNKIIHQLALSFVGINDLSRKQFVIKDIPDESLQFKLWFCGILSIEDFIERIGWI